jgi:hypothetical protein
MKRSRLTESQIVEILKEADAGLPTWVTCPQRSTTSACSQR